jgi:hypothetical protein
MAAATSLRSGVRTMWQSVVLLLGVALAVPATAAAQSPLPGGESRELCITVTGAAGP